MRNIKYRFEFATQIGGTKTQYKCHIYKEGYEGSATTLTTGATPIVLTEEAGEDEFTPLHTSSGYISLEGLTVEDVVELSPNDAKDMYVEMFRNDVLCWFGYVQPCSYSMSWDAFPLSYDLPIDGMLNVMQSGLIADENRGRVSMWQFIKDALDFTDAPWGNIYIPYNFKNDNDTSPHKSNYQQCLKSKIWNCVFLSDKDDRSGAYEDRLTYKEVMEELCKAFGWSLTVDGRNAVFTADDEFTKYLVVPYDRLDELITKSYDTFAVVEGLQVIDRGDVSLNTFFGGGQFEMVEGVKEVEYEVKSKQFLNDSISMDWTKCRQSPEYSGKNIADGRRLEWLAYNHKNMPNYTLYRTESAQVAGKFDYEHPVAKCISNGDSTRDVFMCSEMIEGDSSKWSGEKVIVLANCTYASNKLQPCFMLSTEDSAYRDEGLYWALQVSVKSSNDNAYLRNYNGGGLWLQVEIKQGDWWWHDSTQQWLSGKVVNSLQVHTNGNAAMVENESGTIGTGASSPFYSATGYVFDTVSVDAPLEIKVWGWTNGGNVRYLTFYDFSLRRVDFEQRYTSLDDNGKTPTGASFKDTFSREMICTPYTLNLPKSYALMDSFSWNYTTGLKPKERYLKRLSKSRMRLKVQSLGQRVQLPSVVTIGDDKYMISAQEEDLINNKNMLTLYKL